MRLRRSTGAAVAAAVIAGTLGAVPAWAGPAAGVSVGGDTGAAGTDTAGQDTATGGDGDAGHGAPQVFPRPRTLRTEGKALADLRVGERVTLVADPGADPYALDLLRSLLSEAGAQRLTTVRPDAVLPADTGTVVRAGQDASPGSGTPQHGGLPPGQRDERSAGGGNSERRPAEPAVPADLPRTLAALGAPTADGPLPPGGYRLAAGRTGGREVLALAGAGEDGLFHAVQTLRQLLDGDRIPGVAVRDWPAAPVRGLTEGFYGTPWSHGERLAQLDFLGRTKQNRYVYAPGADPYRQSRWRTPYPADEQREFRELAERARRNHVTLAWAVAPGQSMCLSSKKDLRALLRKVDAMRELGVRAFQLQFGDVSYSEWHCGEDADEFGSGPEAAARAHARVANALAGHLARGRPGAEPLTLLPTEYYQDGRTGYRTALSKELDPAVRVAWTGVGVVPRTVTAAELARTRRAFGPDRKIVTADNYPVNDFAEDQLHLGPYTGRAPEVAERSAALLANAMERPVSSRMALFTTGDFAWNPRGYRADASWRAAAEDLAGGDGDTTGAVRALSRNTASSMLGSQESAYLVGLIADLWAARRSPDPERPEAAARTLRTAFSGMRAAPGQLAGTELAAEASPWIAQLAAYGRAGESAVDMLQAQAHGDGVRAVEARRALTEARRDIAGRQVEVGAGVLDPFLDRAEDAYRNWTGAPAPRTGAVGGEHTLDADRRLVAVSVQSTPGTGGTVELRTASGEWRSLGPLDPRGWTQLDGHDLRARQLRVTGSGGGSVREVGAWYATDDPAELGTDRERAHLDTGGTTRFTARLTALTEADVKGKLTAEAPEGLEVRLPRKTTLPRGRVVDVPVEVRAAGPGDRGPEPGTYRVRLSYAGATHEVQVTVRPERPKNADTPKRPKKPGKPAE